MAHLRLSRLLGSHRWILVPLAVIGVAVSSTYIGQAVATATIFGRVLDSGADDVLMNRLVTPLTWLAAVLLARPVLVLAREVLAVRLMTAAKIRLRDEVGVQLTLESARDAGRGRTGSDNATLVDGIENLDPYLSKYLPSLLTGVIVCSVVAALLVAVDPVVGIVVVSAAVTLPLLPRLWDAALARRGADHWEAYQELHAEFVDSMQGMTTLVLFGAAERRQRELAGASERLLARTLHQLKISLVESGLNTFALTAVPLVALLTAWGRHNSLTGSEIFAVVLLSVELVRPLRDLASQWHAGYLGTFSGEQITQVLDRRDGAVKSSVAATDRPTVTLRGVTHTYPAAPAPALDGVDLDAGPGLTAVVGASGSGKSTVAALLAGLCDPISGEARISHLTAAPDRLAVVALVPQDPVLFPGTVRSNIELGRARDTSVTITAEKAAHIAGIATDDPTLTLDSTVGERGGLVSGGQRQRIAIARGLMQDRPVLVLDEATSALDIESEKAILRRVEAARLDRPLIVIAHRLQSVRDATSITVLHEGKSVEQGTHASLVAAGGRYARLVSAAAVPAGER